MYRREEIIKQRAIVNLQTRYNIYNRKTCLCACILRQCYVHFKYVPVHVHTSSTWPRPVTDSHQRDVCVEVAAGSPCRGGADGRAIGPQRARGAGGRGFNLFAGVPHENRVRFKTLIFRSCPCARWTICTLYAICINNVRETYG